MCAAGPASISDVADPGPGRIPYQQGGDDVHQQAVERFARNHGKKSD
jgi:hypothetical protein